MSEAVDLAALAARGVNHVTLARGVEGESGSGTDYTGWSDASSVFVSAKVGLREQSRGFARMVLTVEGSSNGSDWSTLATLTFGSDGEQTASFDSPPDHLRASWAITGGSEWMIFYVRASPSVIDAPGGGGGGSQAVKIVDLGTVDWASVFTNGPQTLYTLQAGESLASIRYLDDVYEALDVVPITGFAGIGTTRSFSWWSFAPIVYEFGASDGTCRAPLDTLGMFTRNYHDFIDTATGPSRALLQTGGTGPLGLSYGPDLAATDNSNYGRAQVLSAVGDVQASFAFQNGGLYSYRLAAIDAWVALTHYDLAQDPFPTVGAAPQKAAIVANGTVWFNSTAVLGAAGTSGASSPDFAGNAGGSVADGANIVWLDTLVAPPSTGQVHAVAEIWIAS